MGEQQNKENYTYFIFSRNSSENISYFEVKQLNLKINELLVQVQPPPPQLLNSIGRVPLLHSGSSKFESYRSYIVNWKYSKDGQCTCLKNKLSQFESRCFHIIGNRKSLGYGSLTVNQVLRGVVRVHLVPQHCEDKPGQARKSHKLQYCQFESDLRNK